MVHESRGLVRQLRYGVRTDSYVVTRVIALLTLFFSMTVAFIAGMTLVYLCPASENWLNMVEIWYGQEPKMPFSLGG